MHLLQHPLVLLRVPVLMLRETVAMVQPHRMVAVLQIVALVRTTSQMLFSHQHRANLQHNNSRHLKKQGFVTN
jgi:hypothetical protein